MRQEYRDTSLLDTAQKIWTRKLFRQDVDAATFLSEPIRHLRGQLRFFKPGDQHIDLRFATPLLG